MEIVQGPEKEPVETKKEEHKGFEFSYEAFSQNKMGIFWGGLQKAFTCKTYPNFKSAHRIKRLCNAIQAELKNFNELMKEIAELEDTAEQDKKRAELCELKVHIKWDPLSEAELESIQNVSPADIEGLEFIADPSCFQ